MRGAYCPDVHPRLSLVVLPLRLKTCLLIAALLTLGTAAHALTARNLSTRMRIDGYTDDFKAGDEDVFGYNTSGVFQEPRDDSKWGYNEEILQIRVTWDAQYLYFAVEGVCWDNNMILFLDTLPGRGMSDMSNLNSWRRNFQFDQTARTPGDEFAPDVFGATWDRNTSPRLISHVEANKVLDEQVGPNFRAAASFDQGNTGRAMEFALPWRNVFDALGGGPGTRDTIVSIGGVTDTVRRMPLGVHNIKICAVLTGGGDGTGGPDSAPDNLSGHTNDGNAQVLIDNYAILDLDRNDDIGSPSPDGIGDGVPDWGVSPITRVTFRYDPPLKSVRFSLTDLKADRPAFAPDKGESTNFRFKLTPPLNPDIALDRARTVSMTANVYDVTGHWVRNLFIKNDQVINNQPSGIPLPLLAINADETLAEKGYSRWDGRDASGHIVPAGIYVLRVVIEPNLDRAVRAVVVVR
jgi:hypothetical protein